MMNDIKGFYLNFDASNHENFKISRSKLLFSLLF